MKPKAAGPRKAPLSPRFFALLRKSAVALTFAAAVVVALLWLAGAFATKVSANGAGGTDRPVGDATLAEVRRVRLPRVETAVGTIRAVREAAVASNLLAKVREVRIKAGQCVAAGELLVKLDDEDLKARLEQSGAAVSAAEAARDQARLEMERVKGMFESNAAAQTELDRAHNALKGAQADVDRAQQAKKEAETVLAYATIAAPFAGTVVDKRVDAGDTVTPGQVVATLYDPSRMQLVASVREGLTQRLKPGQTIDVSVAALGRTCAGQISEIVPEAESASRTFAVKVTGPCPPGIYSGMFGRLLIPLDEEEVLTIPRDAVRRVGQLDVVDVAEGGLLSRRSVRLGRDIQGEWEVLSGLKEGERVAVAVRKE